MANKELVIKTTVDTSGVDKAMQELRQKMSQTQGLSPNIQGSQLGIGDRLSLAAQNDVQRYNQKMQDDLRREHSLRQAQYKQSLDAERDLKRFKESGQDVEKEINQELEKRIKLLKEMKEIQEKMGDGGGRVPPTGGQPPAGGGEGGGRGGVMGGIMDAARSAMTVGALATVVTSISNIATQFAEMERNVGMNRGAVSRTAMQMSKEGLSGLGMEPITFASERQEAFSTVMDEMSTRRMRDLTGNFGANSSIIGGIIGGAGLGLPLGPLGMIGGGILGGGAALLANLGLNRDFRSAAFNTEDYQTMISKEAMDKFAGLEQANRLKNFEKYRAYEFMGENLGSMTGAQKAFGIGSPEGVVNFMSGMTGAGVTSARGLQIAQSLMGESGMTMSARDPETLRRMRDLQAGGLTNATSVFGRLMSLGTQTQGQEEFKRVMEGAVRGGINSSEMVEETKRFADIATSLALQAGSDAGTIAQMLGSGMIGTDARSMQAAQTAMQMYDQESAGLTGIKGALKFSAAYSPEGRERLGGLADNRQLLSYFLDMPMTQFTPENPMVQRMIEAMGPDATFEQAREQKQYMTQRGATVRGATFKQLQDFSKIANLSEDEYKKAISKGGEGFEAYTDILAALGEERGSALRNVPQMEQMSLIKMLGQGEISVEELQKRAAQAAKQSEEFFTRGGGSIEATFEGSKARQEQVQYEGLLGTDKETGLTFINRFMEDAKKMASGATEINDAFKSLKDAASAGIVSMGAFKDAMDAMGAYAKSAGNDEDRRKFMDTLEKIGATLGQTQTQPTASPDSVWMRR
jgi:hypothetical protein